MPCSKLTGQTLSSSVEAALAASHRSVPTTFASSCLNWLSFACDRMLQLLECRY